MPIRPRYAPSEGRPVAQRQFTNREDFIKTFRYALAAERISPWLSSTTALAASARPSYRIGQNRPDGL